MTQGRVPLSVAIISFNEEANIGRCLEAVRELATEIIVVDSHSSDRTVEIAKSLGANVFVEEWKGHIAQKNSALEKCSGDWILALDCDEVVSPQLLESIRLAVSQATNNAYRLNRKTFFLDKWIEHAWYPDWKIRLIRRGTGIWGGMNPHDTLIINAACGNLSGDLYHYSFKNLQDCLDRMVRYAANGADSYYLAGKRVKVTNLLLNPLHGFIKHYFLKRGFLDGLPGFIISITNGMYVFMKYAMLWEKQRANRGNNR